MDESGALAYENRRGDVFYLQAGKTPSGKPKYYAALKVTGRPVAALPEGYEIYEKPDTAQVFVRKVKPSRISELERKQAEAAVREASGLEYFIVAIEGDALVVYTPSTRRSEFDRLMAELASFALRNHPAALDAARDQQLRRCPYVKMLRFALVDPDTRCYHAQRWCFRGSIDDWIALYDMGPLITLVAKYAKHLDSESFFELM